MDFLDTPIDELQLSVRSFNCLKNANISTVRELVAKSKGELLTTKHFGRLSLAEIEKVLASMGLRLSDDDDS